ncbi:MAG TPA: class I SAM-dependent methyltransferase [Solirubrobacteraceae bacterium]|nr:class I SAM-dependent methyltransferase [Solirubrobacteraceae bacterium]
MTGEHDELWDLENLRAARRLGDWMYEQFDPYVGAETIEVGAGIGTFSERLAKDSRVRRLLLIEPEPPCADVLARDFADDPRVTVTRETLPESPALLARGGQADFLLCQNVLEHIDEEVPALRAMAAALRPGGHLTLLVPAHPRLYGNLDRLYGHYRRYTREHLRDVVTAAGLEIDELYSFNLLGVPGWWINRFRHSPQISSSSLRAYEALLRLWQPIERRRRPPWGLSLIAQARKPAR